MSLPFLVTIHNRRAPVQQPFHSSPGQVLPSHFLSAVDLCSLAQTALTEAFTDSTTLSSNSSVRLLLPTHISLSGPSSVAPRFVQAQVLLDAPASVLLGAAERAAGSGYEAQFSKYDVSPDDAIKYAPNPSDVQFDYGTDSDGEKITFAKIRNALIALRQAPSIKELEKLEVGDLKNATATASGRGIEMNFLPTSRSHRLPIVTYGATSLLSPPAAVNLAVFDMDSTLIDQEVIDELARTLGEPFCSSVADITDRAMRGELDFEASLRERVRLLKGIPGGDVFDDVKPSISIAAGVRAIFKILHRPASKTNPTSTFNHLPTSTGVETAVLSGGFMPLANWIARKEELGIDHVHANVLDETGPSESDRANGEIPVLSGELVGEIVGPLYKRKMLQTLERRSAASVGQDGKTFPADGLSLPCRVLAVGDGANDLYMLRAADTGVAYRAKELVQRLAPLRLNLPLELVEREARRESDRKHKDDQARNLQSRTSHGTTARSDNLKKHQSEDSLRDEGVSVDVDYHIGDSSSTSSRPTATATATRTTTSSSNAAGEYKANQDRKRDLAEEPAGVVDVLYLLGWNRDMIAAAVRS